MSSIYRSPTTEDEDQVNEGGEEKRKENQNLCEEGDDERDADHDQEQHNGDEDEEASSGGRSWELEGGGAGNLRMLNQNHHLRWTRSYNQSLNN